MDKEKLHQIIDKFFTTSRPEKMILGATLASVEYVVVIDEGGIRRRLFPKYIRSDQIHVTVPELELNEIDEVSEIHDYRRALAEFEKRLRDAVDDNVEGILAELYPDGYIDQMTDDRTCYFDHRWDEGSYDA